MTEVKVCSTDGDTYYFDIVAGVLPEDTLASYLFIICLDYVFRTSIDLLKENGLKQTKERSRRYPVQTITDVDYADDIALLANSHAWAESLLQSLELATGSIDLHVNADKTEYSCFNKNLKKDISRQNGGPLKQVDKFTYIGSSVSSTENDINTWLAKAGTAIDRLSIIWKSYLTEKIKRSFFPKQWLCRYYIYGCTTWTLTKCMKKKLDGNYTRTLRTILKKSWGQHLKKTATARTMTTHQENYPS